MPDEPIIDELEQVERKRADGARWVYEDIWEKFSVDRKKSRSLAYRNLQRRLSRHAADLVPAYLTAKEHMSMIADIEEWTKSEKETDSESPSDLMASWLSGATEMSRIPLEILKRKH